LSSHHHSQAVQRAATLFLRGVDSGCSASCFRQARLILFGLLLCAFPCAYAQSPKVLLQFSPAQTKINFTLGDILHTVHGSFSLKRGDVEYDLTSRSVRGELVVDATTGQSGNRTRDGKMHREILESARYPEVIFRPDKVEGTLARGGTSTVQVRGIFTIHGNDHEIIMPVRVEMFPDHWTASTHFTVPYVKWGLKNPSTFLLRVSESVEIDVRATGPNPWSSDTAH
jgi:polyisoprenoid-binding protein YceI